MSYLTVGDARKFIAKLYDLSGILTDPNTITLEIRKPDETILTYSDSELTKESIGIYSKIVLVDQSGEWYIEWQSTGAVQKVANSSFYVRPQKIIPE